MDQLRVTSGYVDPGKGQECYIRGRVKMTEMKRLAAYLPDPIYAELERWADEEKRSLSNLVGFLLEAAVREREKAEKAESVER